MLLLFGGKEKMEKELFLNEDETIWMPQKKMAELFDVNVPAISKHLKNIFESGELDEKVVVSNLETTTPHGAIQNGTQTKSTRFYNLDAIIAVGYRVNSSRATQFRIWATQVLKEFIITGYVMDVERLKNPKPLFGEDYFKEQLEKIRDIRSRERRLYQQIMTEREWFILNREYRMSKVENFQQPIPNNPYQITNIKGASHFGRSFFSCGFMSGFKTITSGC